MRSRNGDRLEPVEVAPQTTEVARLRLIIWNLNARRSSIRRRWRLLPGVPGHPTDVKVLACEYLHDLREEALSDHPRGRAKALRGPLRSSAYGEDSESPAAWGRQLRHLDSEPLHGAPESGRNR